LIFVLQHIKDVRWVITYESVREILPYKPEVAVNEDESEVRVRIADTSSGKLV
jgi:hypothetical protein